MTPTEVLKLCGWTPNPEAVKSILRTMPMPYFADAAPHLMAKAANDDKNALLYEACKKVTGDNLPAHKQSIGCCESEGWSSGVDYLQCVEIALGGKAFDYEAISHGVFYGLGREVANMLGGGDGCYGGAMAKAAVQFGCVSNADAKDSDTDDTLAKEYGSRGVPADLKALAKKHLVKTTSLVKSADEAKAALQNGYPVPISSDQGFSMERDSDGMCRAEGSWAHCMLLIGYRGDKKWFCILQSWGKNTPSGPTALGQPDCSFWAEWDAVDHMLKQEDSFAASNFDGYPSRDIPWIFA